ncbi:MAG: hypothetical protein U1G08_19425 [Verrucomicrobiota bacterium]
MKSTISIFLLAATVALAAPPEAIQRVTLDERVVITVPVSTNRVTTISFPGPIAAIDAVGVTADGKTPGNFQLAHTKGSSFVSVRALARKAATNLNIRWNKRTYVFELIEGDAPVLALNLEDRAASEIVQPAPQVTPTRLVALLDKAKAFPLLKKQQPDAVAGAEARSFGDEPQVTDFNDHEIRIEEVFRFNPEDTLVFHVTLRNKSEREIRYLPESFCTRVGSRLYYQSVSDAPGLLPPHAVSTVYFAITGTPDGGRNELSLKNEFSVLVSRLPSPPPSPTAAHDTSNPPQFAPPPPPPSSPSVQVPPHTGMTPEQEALARQTLRRVIADLDNTNAPSAKQTRP